MEIEVKCPKCEYENKFEIKIDEIGGKIEKECYRCWVSLIIKPNYVLSCYVKIDE